jgi:hypothetical protein
MDNHGYPWLSIAVLCTKLNEIVTKQQNQKNKLKMPENMLIIFDLYGSFFHL